MWATYLLWVVVFWCPQVTVQNTQSNQVLIIYRLVCTSFLLFSVQLKHLQCVVEWPSSCHATVPLLWLVTVQNSNQTMCYLLRCLHEFSFVFCAAKTLTVYCGVATIVPCDCPSVSVRSPSTLHSSNTITICIWHTNLCHSPCKHKNVWWKIFFLCWPICLEQFASNTPPLRFYLLFESRPQHAPV